MFLEGGFESKVAGLCWGPRFPVSRINHVRCITVHLNILMTGQNVASFVDKQSTTNSIIFLIYYKTLQTLTKVRGRKGWEEWKLGIHPKRTVIPIYKYNFKQRTSSSPNLRRIEKETDHLCEPPWMSLLNYSLRWHITYLSAPVSCQI